MIEREILGCIKREMRHGKAILIYGARRVGKTVLIEHIAKNFSGKVSLLNGEDATTTALLQEHTIANYRQLFQGTDLPIDFNAHKLDMTILAKGR